MASSIMPAHIYGLLELKVQSHTHVLISVFFALEGPIIGWLMLNLGPTKRSVIFSLANRA